MTATKGFTGKGTVLSIGSGGTGEQFTAIVQVKTFQFSGQKWSFDDATNAGSPAVGVGVLKESIPSTMDAGDMAIAGIFLPSDPGQLALATAFNAGTLTDFKLQVGLGPGQTVVGNLYTFSGYLQELPAPNIQFDKIIDFKASIKLNTVITVTQGS